MNSYWWFLLWVCLYFTNDIQQNLNLISKIHSSKTTVRLKNGYRWEPMVPGPVKRFKGISPITSVKDSRSALILLIWTATPLQIDCYACLCPFWFVWNSFQWFVVENPCAAISQLGTSVCQNLWIWQNRTRVRPLRGKFAWPKFAYRF